MATYVRYRGLDRPQNAEAVAGDFGTRLPSAWGLNYPAGVKASLTTAHTGTNNDLTITANYGGTWANAFSLEFEGGGTNAVRTLVPTFTGNDIAWELMLVTTSGSVQASETAASIRAFLNADPLFGFLFTAELATSNDGTGVVADSAALGLGATVTGTAVGASEPLFVTANSQRDVVVDIESRVVQRYLRKNYYRLVSLGAV